LVLESGIVIRGGEGPKAEREYKKV